MQTGTIFSGVGHAGLILWVLVGDWLFPARPPEDVIVTSTTIMTSAEFDALRAASTPSPSEETAPLRPQARPEPEPEPEAEPEPEPEPIPEPETEPTPEPEPEPIAPPAEEEQALPSPSLEEQPLPEAAEIVAPSPVEVETEAETSDTPTPAVSDAPAEAEVVQERPTEETVAEDTGDVLETEANRDQDEATGMTTSLRPRVRPERPEPVEEPEPEMAAADPVADAPEPAEDPAAEDALAALLDEAVEAQPENTGGQALPKGPPLTGGEMGNISSAVARKWNLGASSTDTLRTKVVLRVSFAPDGRPTDFVLILAEGPSQTAIDQLNQTAQRAVNRAYADGGLPLPPEKYETWKVLDLVFDANGMTLR